MLFVSTSCNQVMQFLTSVTNLNLFFSGKEEVKDGDPAKWSKKPNLPEVTKSWHNYMIKEVIQDFQSTVLQVTLRILLSQAVTAA